MKFLKLCKAFFLNVVFFWFNYIYLENKIWNNLEKVRRHMEWLFFMFTFFLEVFQTLCFGLVIAWICMNAQFKISRISNKLENNPKYLIQIFLFRKYLNMWLIGNQSFACALTWLGCLVATVGGTNLYFIEILI